jgi:hypothetical protein
MNFLKESLACYLAIILFDHDEITKFLIFKEAGCKGFA